MASVTFVLADGTGAHDGGVDFEWTCDPPMDPEKLTDAQCRALEIIQFLNSRYGWLEFEPKFVEK